MFHILTYSPFVLTFPSHLTLHNVRVHTYRKNKPFCSCSWLSPSPWRAMREWR